MRLTVKLTLLLMLGIGGVLAVQAVLHLRSLERLHAAESRDDLTILARALRSAIVETWRVSGRARALRYVQKAARSRASTRLRLLPFAEVRRGLRTVDASALLRGQQLVGPRRTEHRLVLLAPIKVGKNPLWILEVSRSLKGSRDFRKRTVQRVFVTTGLLLIGGGVIALLLGVLFVGRPVEALVDLAKRVATGDYTVTRPPRARDEIGRLAREMHQMANRLADAHQRVKDEQRARTLALEGLRHADRLSTVGKVASRVAHELGTPLSVIVGRARMIATGEVDGEEAARNAALIADQAERISSLIRQLLDFSRRRSRERERRSAGAVIAQAAELMLPIAAQKGVDIAVGQAVTDDVLDSGRILQVLTNLITNAIHAMPRGGRIRIEAAHESITTPPDPESPGGEYLRFTVADEGVGIPDDVIEHIFEPFFTTKRVGEGTGLGLTVCQTIVREEGGWIDVDSQTGQGTTFSVYIPSSEQPPAPANS